MPSKQQQQISAGRTPDGRTPDGRTPDGRTPDGRTPDGRTPEGRPPARKKWQPKYRAAALGIELLGAILGFTLVGLWVDSQYGTSPWGLLICVIVGFVGGFYNLIRSSLEALATAPGKSSEEKTSGEVSEEETEEAREVAGPES